MSFADDLPRFQDVPHDAPLQPVIRRLDIAPRPRGGIDVSLNVQNDDAVVTGRDDWHRLAAAMNDDEGQAAVKKIDDVRNGGDAVRLECSTFGFRHGSAGVLPLVRTPDGVDSLLLFLRDIPPTGWNVANGGAQSVDDLIHIDKLMQREFGEEVLFRAPNHGRFGRPRTLDSEEARRARRLWAEAHGAFDREPVTLETAWAPGPDRLTVQLPGGAPVRTDGLYLTFDGQGFAIECSRIVRIEMPVEFIPLDGELAGDDLLDRPTGLFDPESLRDGDASPHSCTRGGAPIDVLTGHGLCPVSRDLVGRLLG